MPQRGPLIPGHREFDVPRSRRAGPLVWVIAVAATCALLVFLAGVFGGVGPLRALGAAESPLVPIAWRATASASVIQVAVAVPPSGLCPTDEVKVQGIERPGQVLVEATRTQPRGSRNCTGTGIAGDRLWVDVTLDQPLGDRSVLRESDKLPIPREGPLG